MKRRNILRAGALTLVLSGLPVPTAPSFPDADLDHSAFDVLHKRDAERLLNEAAAAGFRLVQFRPGFRSGWTRGGYAALLERRDEADRPADYRILVHAHLDHLEEQLNEAASQGFRFLPHTFFHQQRGAAPFQDAEYVAVLGRFPGRAVQRHYLVRDGEALLDSIRIAVQRGYEVVGFTAGAASPAVILEIYFRGGVPDGELPPDDLYREVEAGRLATLRKRLRDAPSEGYGLFGTAAAGGRHVALLRRDPDAASVEYRVPQPKRLLEELVAGGAEGFRLVPGTLGSVPILERGAGDVRYEYDSVGPPAGPASGKAAADPWERRSRADRKGDAGDPDRWLRDLDGRVAAGWSARGLLGPDTALVERRSGPPP